MQARKLAVGVFSLSLVAGLSLVAQSPTAAHEDSSHLALTPPMGWNSWNAFHKNIDEQLIKDTADAMAESGMRDAGYQHVVVDGGWRASVRDDDGQMQAHPERFPSGMKALADYVHSKGLKFGLHQAVDEDDCGNASPGTGSAPGDTYAEKAQHDAATFARWGVDYLKFDQCGEPEGRPPGMSVKEWKKVTFKAMGDALEGTGRDIVYSVSEYGVDQPWKWAADVGAHLWRTSRDIAPTWDSTGKTVKHRGVVNHIDDNATLAPYAGPGHWNDPDMLEVGVQAWGQWPGLTDTESQAHFSMWAIMASPLMAAADLRTMTPTTREILTNKEVIAVNQDSLGTQGSRVHVDGETEVWAKPLANGDYAVALLNRGDEPATIRTSADTIGMKQGGGYLLRDLWSHKDTFTSGVISASTPGHGVTMYRVRPGTPDEAPPATELTVESPEHVTPGETSELTTTFVNHGRTDVEDVRVDLKTPSGWTAEATSAVAFDEVAPHKSVKTTWNVTPSRDAEPGTHDVRAGARYTYRDGAGPASTDVTKTVAVVVPPPGGESYVSDLAWLSAANHWGPVELDTSNGTRAAGDGNPITLNGVVHDKGLGVHAYSKIRYYLGGECSTFAADVGVDDEVGDEGSVVFGVWADDRKVYDSGVMTGSSPAKTIAADVSGADELTLVVENAEDGGANDHADWADARITCAA